MRLLAAGCVIKAGKRPVHITINASQEGLGRAIEHGDMDAVEIALAREIDHAIDARLRVHLDARRDDRTPRREIVLMASFPAYPPSRSTRMVVSPSVKSHRFGDGHVRYLTLRVGQRHIKNGSCAGPCLRRVTLIRLKDFLNSNDGNDCFNGHRQGRCRGPLYLCVVVLDA